MRKPTHAQQLYEAAINEFLSGLREIPDPRRAQGRRYGLDLVLGTAVMAMLSGCDNAEHMELWGNTQRSWLANFFEMPHGPPTQDVFLRVLGALDPDSFQSFFHEWVTTVLRRVGKQAKHIAIDGKSSRRSYGRDEEGNKTRMLHMVSAYCSELRLVLGQVKTDDKSNEVTAISELLKTLDVKDATVTIDALGAQKTIAKSIADKGGHYLLSVKDNQPTLHADIQALFEDLRLGVERPKDQPQLSMTKHRSVDKGHGRVEERTVRVSDDVAYLGNARKEWEGLSLLIEVESKRTESGHTSLERRHYISNGTGMSAEEVGALIRRHWAIENELHWVLDVAFREDDARHHAEHCATNMATLRHFALNLLKGAATKKKVGIAAKRKLCGFSLDFLAQVLSTV